MNGDIIEVFSCLSYREISFNILRWISAGSTYKAATRVCRLWHIVCVEELQWMIAAYSNHLWTLIDKYPHKNWNWMAISRNPNITWKIIKSHQDKNWNWNNVSGNPNITW